MVVAGLVQGSIGLGFALVVAPVAAVARSEMIPAAIILLMMPINVFVIWREFGHFDFPGASWITFGRFVGTFAGLWVLLMVSTQVLGAAIGATTIAAAIATKLAPRFTPNRTAYLSAGFITGVTETATGIGGPPLALVYQHHPAATLRATLALCFLIGQIFSVAFLIFKNRFDISHLQDALLLLPFVAIGLLCSYWGRRKLDGARLRTALLTFAVASGIFLILQPMIS